MVHWQIKLIDWRLGHTEWWGRHVIDNSKIYLGMYKDVVIPERYDSLEEARRVASSFSDKMKQTYQIKIFKITSKSKRKR